MALIGSKGFRQGLCIYYKGVAFAFSVNIRDVPYKDAKSGLRPKGVLFLCKGPLRKESYTCAKWDFWSGEFPTMSPKIGGVFADSVRDIPKE